MLKTLLSRVFANETPAVWDGGAGSSVVSIDRDGRIGDLCEQGAKLLHAPRRSALGASFAELFAPEDRERIGRGFSLGAAAGVIRARLADGGAALDLRFSLRNAGAAALVVAVETPEASASPSSREALADVSHEMRTPLNAVIGFADAMLSETYGPLGHDKYQEYATIIRASGKHLLDLVNAALDLVRLDAGRYALKRETVDVGEIARECASLVRIEAEKAGLRLNVAVADDLPEASLDARALRQILINLLANAVKFTSDGEVTLSARAEGETLVLTVADTGVGMSEQELQKLGARFAAKGADGVRGAKGTGLGLSLAFALVELHGGALTFASAPGEGLRAEARLPIVAPARPIRRLRAVVTGELPPAAPPRILTELERVEAYRRERARSAA